MAAGIACGQDLAATTSVLSSVIKDITKEQLKVETLVPSGSCPGHFDLNVNHLRLIEKTGILFAHGFEEYLEKIKQSVNNTQFTPFIIEVEGNWLVPESQKQAYGKITKILSGKFPKYADFFEKNRKQAEEGINETDRDIKSIAAEKKFSGKPVICNSHIKEILEYTGFDVVATYGRKEELTPSTIKNLINLCKEKKVRLVVDNLQAGPDTGRVISEELKIPHLAISNFPGVFPGTPTLRQTLYENVKRIVDIYENSQNKTD